MVIVGGAESVAMSPPKFVVVPVAMQLALLAHETPRREPTPDGTTTWVQVEPVSMVSRIVMPPTAVQLDELKHETSDKVVDPAGDPRSFQAVPPSVVPMACEPTAMQSVVVEQEIPLSVVTPAGDVWGDQDEPFVVVTMAALVPPDEEPTAKQVRSAAQEIPVKFVTVAGMDSEVHVVPPFVVPTMLGEPVVESKSLTALHDVGLEQETAESVPTFGGTDWLVHVAPASFVVMITGLEKMPKPTAMHWKGDGHEMPVKPLTLDGIAWEFQVRPMLVV